MGKDPRRKQFGRGVKFANVPGGKAEFAVIDSGVGPRVHHVNTTMNVAQLPCDQPGISGVIRYRRTKIPLKVKPPEGRNLDVFGNPLLK